MSKTKDLVDTFEIIIDNNVKEHRESAKVAISNAIEGFIILRNIDRSIERILCAAIWYKDLPNAIHQCKNITQGIVVTGLRHCNCVDVMARLGQLRSVTFAPDGVGEHEQGFLTSHNRYVNREEAYQIARKAGQILITQTQNDTELYSEDLY